MQKFGKVSRLYFDTSVLYPAIIKNHENHEVARDLLANSISQGEVVTSATHAYAELYRQLTRGNSPGQLSPQMAQSVISALTSKFIMVALDGDDYLAALQRCVDLNLSSSIIYDALHVQAALKANATTLYTDNLKDFTRLVTPEDNLQVKGIRNIRS